MERYVHESHAQISSWGIDIACCDPQGYVPETEVDTMPLRVSCYESMFCCSEDRKEHEV